MTHTPSELKATVVSTVLLLAAACGGSPMPPPSTVGQGAAIVLEAWQTERDTVMDIDSPAVWHGPAGEHWMLVTSKAKDLIRVHDASTGRLLRDVGVRGNAPGAFRRPNGIAVVDDLLWVVERDGRRVQLFRLPDFTVLGQYGVPELVKPYGIAVVRHGAGRYRTWVTDSYELVPDEVPPDSALGRRVREYVVTVAQGGLTSALVRTFGDTAGPGVLRVVESIAADSTYRRLLIAEELEGASLIKVYDWEGRFTGDTIAASFFPNQAEGIVLYACGDSSGYWVATDQGKQVNTFHLFDRVDFRHLGSFQSKTILNTDGIALTQRGFPGFPAGAFFAVHDDGGVAAIAWPQVAEPAGLRTDCVR